MKKVAFFVEGLTEQLFLENLLLQVFGEKQIALEIKKIRGGSKVPITITALASPNVDEAKDFYVLIYDCGGDSNVRSYIEDQRNSLIASDYIKIVGLLDIYPNFTREEIHDLQYGLYYRLPQKDLETKFILSIMEIEAWFIAESEHFLKIDNRLTPEYIETNFGFNPTTYDTQKIDEPANDLNKIYQSVGQEYVKVKEVIEKTVDAIDYGDIYFETHKRISSLKDLIDEINLIFE